MVEKDSPTPRNSPLPQQMLKLVSSSELSHKTQVRRGCLWMNADILLLRTCMWAYKTHACVSPASAEMHITFCAQCVLFTEVIHNGPFCYFFTDNNASYSGCDKSHCFRSGGMCLWSQQLERLLHGVLSLRPAWAMLWDSFTTVIIIGIVINHII